MRKTILGGVAIGLVAGALATPELGRSQVPVRVIDGDTIVVGAEHIRLYGIDAPESKQHCADGWDAGRHATAALRALLDDGASTIHADRRGVDRYGRTLAIVTVDGGHNVNAEMVSQGMAWAYLEYTWMYANEQAIAKIFKRGVHAHDCDMPSQWRHNLKR